MKLKIFVSAMLAAMAVARPQPTEACTGITLRSGDGAYIVARTIEWGGSNLNSQYVIVPRGHVQQSYTPSGIDGLRFAAVYGYVGFAVEQKEFVAEGINEVGLSAGLFYFPGYGEYEEFDTAAKSSSIADLQLVPWILGSCRTVDEVKEAVSKVHVIAIYPGASTVHWRFSDQSGRQVVLEIIDGRPVFYENELGVLTNSPDFNWQITNLNNYVNLYPGAASVQDFGAIKLAPFGAGSGMLGIPGDVTPPSRFVRAAFFQTSAPQQESAVETVVQCFHILNNFDIPIGVETLKGDKAADIPSATQWTAVSDVTNRIIYYRTMYNSSVRSIDLASIDFAKVRYRAEPLDKVAMEPITAIKIR